MISGTVISKKSLLNDLNQWNALIEEKSYAGEIILDNIEIENRDFSGYDFRNISFENCTFKNCIFKNSLFSKTRLCRSKNNICKFIECDFSGKLYRGHEIIFNYAYFDKCIFKNVQLNSISLQNCTFLNCLWHNSHFQVCHFNESSLFNSTFENTKFKHCDFYETKWGEATISPKTEFEYCFFDKAGRNIRHDVLIDQSDTLKFSKPFQFWNWKIISKIGRVPALEFSWTLFGLGLFLISTIIFINESRFILDGIDYPIPIPNNLKIITLGALFASVGTFLFRAQCPDRIQNFTENEWVEGHGHPRLFYREYCLKNITGLGFTTFFLALGIIILGYLIMTRAWYVITHI